jgi:hypothetical protein
LPSLPLPTDPTLEAIDRALVAGQQNRHSNRLGASRIGNPCERALWYEFRWSTPIWFDANTIKNFEDGHREEMIMASRLRLIASIELFTHDEEGQQFEFVACDGHFVCRPDGVILGLLQAPKTPHAWDHKSSSKLNDLQKHINTLGEKEALRAWNVIYYAQALMEMHLTELTRHYLTCSSPGGRQTISCRTEANPKEAKELLAKAQRIIDSENAPERISDSATFFRCRFCNHASICHGDAKPLVNCRTCLHSTPASEGRWACAKWDKILSSEEQKAGCLSHLYIPSMINGTQIDVAEDYSWISYRMSDGSEWRNRING